MDEQKRCFWQIVERLANSSLLENLVLIGSWAEYVYEVGYFSNFKASIRTRDIDIFIPNINKFNGFVNVSELMEELGFVTASDPLTGIHRFYKGNLLEVEFLARELGKGTDKAYYVKTLGLKVEGLRELNFLSKHIIPLKAKGYVINVPYPQAYVFHKMMISRKRKEKVKANKDLRAVEWLLHTIKKEEKDLEILTNIYQGLSEKDKALVDKVCHENHFEVF